MAEVMDMVAGRTFGAVSERNVRVVWTQGRIYIVSESGSVQSYACDKPTKRSGTWQTRIGEAALSCMPAGCGSCRRRVMASVGGKMSLEQIVQAGAPADV